MLLPAVLSPSELAAANAAVDSGALGEGETGEWDQVHGLHLAAGSAAQQLVDHPVLVGHLTQLFWSSTTGDMRHGSQYKLEVAPQLLEPPVDPAGPPPPLVGGTAEDGRLDTSRSYFNQAGHRFCHGIKVLFALSDVPADSGGYVCVVGSHKSGLGTPAAVRDGRADSELIGLGVLRRPAMAAGDALIIAAGLLQGPRAWRSDRGGLQPRLLLAEFTAGQARSAHKPPTELATIVENIDNQGDSPPGTASGWVEALPPATQAILTGLDEPAAASQSEHPAMLVPNPELSEEERLEHYLWDLTGFLILRGVFKQEAAAAIAAVEWAYGAGWLDKQADLVSDPASWSDPDTSFGPARRGTAAPPGLHGCVSLPEPHCLPFRAMLAHPEAVKRLRWIMGPGFHLGAKLPSVRLMNKGDTGQLFHAGLNENHKDYHYSLQHAGRTYNEQVNVSFQLCESCGGGGGLVVLPGGHKACHQMPPSMAFQKEMPLAYVHPTTSPGDVIIFCGLGSVHGVRQWNSEWQRRIVIMSYQSHTMGRPLRRYMAPRPASKL